MSVQKSYEIYLYDNKKQNPQNQFCNEQYTKQDEVFKYKYLNLLIMGKSSDYIQQLHEDEQSAWQIQIESENNEDEQEYQQKFYSKDYDHIIEDDKYLHKQGHKKIYQKEIHPLKCKQNGENSFSFQFQTQSYIDQDASPLETLGDIGNYDQNNSQRNLYKQNQKKSQEKYSNAQQLRSKQKKLNIKSSRKMILQQQNQDNNDLFENSIIQKHSKNTIFDLSNLQNQDEIQITDD
ncbi:hypothetical protein PPERSA_02865 [Pseudocohnilembus persalinus]|uniref:Uncharacterized protein n=1 Tax=Pseudocohnilembus persalinus TaxID=266149 RepID=A0A0V0QMK0_PSEPJ|nr:hypothetical protein PPERSA_02865 [Pseudocohnilembus persalinus]|eukprot:KRX03486.1 hypothetical protein PPERSA_02865 [Pseudocohnilembus persalinus]